MPQATAPTRAIRDFFAEEVPHAEDRWIELSVQIAQAVTTERERRGWSLRHLAKIAGTQAPHLSRALSGQHNLTLQTIAELETALEVPLLVVGGRHAASFRERGLPVMPYSEQETLERKLATRSMD